MTISSWLSWPISHGHALRSRRRNPASRPKKARLFLEQLESRVTPSSGLSTLAFFTGANGANPQAGLIMDGSGNLYGTTGSGGANGVGSVFEVAKGSGTVTTLASFDGANGTEPLAKLIMDSSGNLYGTTIEGGVSGYGTVFEVANGSSTITTLGSFNGATGLYPRAGLIMDSSGNLYGTTSQGPAYGTSHGGYGTVFEVANGSRTITTLALLNGPVSGEYPYAALTMDSSGTLYGTTYQGGAGGDGAVFELAKGSNTITALASFNGTNGEYSEAALILDSSGDLYGTTYQGGASGDGTVFEVANGSGAITTLASFNGINGEYPDAALIMDSSGNLYGTTTDGGDGAPYRDGTVFELAKGTSTITTLVSFNGSNGDHPTDDLIMDSSGNLYGTTENGGAKEDGSVFAVLAHTPALNWSYPTNITYGRALSSTQLDAHATDSVTGLAVAGTYVYTPAAGTILAAGIQTLSVTFTPTDTTDYSPITTITTLSVLPAIPVLTWNAPAPITYGAPLSGTQLDATAANPNTGSAVSGIFAYTPGAGTVVVRGSTILNVTFTPTDTTDSTTTAQAHVTLVVTPSYSVSDLAFNGSNGADPIAGLMMDSSGNLYGTTELGGADGDGTVFEVATGSSTFTTLATFNGNNGSDPTGGLIMDSSGNLYGTTGGDDNEGTVFELAKGSGTITTLVTFNGTNGAGPTDSLIMDSSGNLYGTTAGGGVNDGTVFELAKGSHTITTLASFNGANGANPWAGVLMDSSGNLYGTTEIGGANDDGTVFEVVKGSGTITTLASFNGTEAGVPFIDTNGETPLGGVVMDSSGNLYGTTYGALYGEPASAGTVFELAKGSGTITTLASFNGDGYSPVGGLLMDSSGNLYGTTESGGANGDGTVFEVGAGSGLITTMASFGGSNGDDPIAGLLMDSSGNFYGTTEQGGANGDGTVFELPATAHPSLQISGFPSSTSAGSAQTFTVTIQNADGTTDTGYSGTVHFTSSDPQAVLPANYTFTAANAGVYTFAATLKTAGTRSITVADTANSFLTGSATTTVTAAAASSLTIAGFPSPTTAGSAGNLTVTALDAYGNIASGYTGTVQFTSSDAKAALPANYTFTSADAGTHVFPATLETAGTQSITAADTVTSGLNITQTGITVNPAAASVLVITGPSSVTAGVAFSVTVTAYDAYGNVATGYTGTMHFKSTDSTAKLPANYTFKASDKGTRIFSGLVLKKKGQQSITATDTLFSSITGSLSVSVS